MSANPLTSTLAAFIEQAAKAALAMDPSARQSIAELSGQTLLLELTTLPNTAPLGIRISCHEEALGVMADSPHNTRAPNAIVRGHVSDVLRALLSSAEDSGALPKGISIEGDEQLLMSLRQCFSELAPDWRDQLETIISRFTSGGGSGGQVLSDLLGQAELAFDTLRTTIGDMFENTGKQARDVSQKFWAKEDELDAFVMRLENLQLSVDRLSAQIDQLDSKPAQDDDADS